MSSISHDFFHLMKESILIEFHPFSTFELVNGIFFSGNYEHSTSEKLSTIFIEFDKQQVDELWKVFIRFRIKIKSNFSVV